MQKPAGCVCSYAFFPLNRLFMPKIMDLHRDRSWRFYGESCTCHIFASDTPQLSRSSFVQATTYGNDMVCKVRGHFQFELSIFPFQTHSVYFPAQDTTQRDRPNTTHMKLSWNCKPRTGSISKCIAYAKNMYRKNCRILFGILE